MSSPSTVEAEIRLGASVTSRAAILLYGVAAYLSFLVVILYTIGFVGGFVVAKDIETGPPTEPWRAIAVDLGMLALFAVQHGVMARPAFKHRWTQIIPPEIERSTFVLLASALLGLIVWQWRPLPGIVWQVRSPIAIALLEAVYVLGWGIVFYATFLIDHFDLFGLRQTVGHALGWPTRAAQFTERSLYRIVRHPLMLGFLVAFWAAPTMSASRLLFAGGFTVWVLLAIRIEESTLVTLHGEQYESYRRRVPALLPRLRARR
jgi:methanethiol S-methyltransferase